MIFGQFGANVGKRLHCLNPGCRAEALLVSKGGYGVPRGFKGGSKPSAPCGRLSEAEHPKRKGATLLRPLSAVNRNLPGNSHSRASAPCDFRFPPCFFPALRAHGFNPPNPLSPAERRSPIKKHESRQQPKFVFFIALNPQSCTRLPAASASSSSCIYLYTV